MTEVRGIHTTVIDEYWLARDLMPLLEYHKWQDFKEAIERAIEDCAKAQRSARDNFMRLRKNSEGAGRPSVDLGARAYTLAQASEVIKRAKKKAGRRAFSVHRATSAIFALLDTP